MLDSPTRNRTTLPLEEEGDMGLLWTGAAAGVRLCEGDDTTAWAGIYRIDWSIDGAGSVFSYWRGERVRVIAPRRELSEWLNDTFMGPMNRSAALGGVAWDAVEHEEADVELTADPESGARVRAGCARRRSSRSRRVGRTSPRPRSSRCGVRRPARSPGARRCHETSPTDWSPAEDSARGSARAAAPKFRDPVRGKQAA